MCNVGKMHRRAGCLAGRQRILAALAILGSMCAVAGAQIDVNETGLHDGQSVYGLYAPPTPIPYVNLEDITLFAWGETDPSLYTNVSFYAHGLYTDVNVVNIGAIGVTATGGMADASALDVYADARARAYGIYSAYGLITNDGRIDVVASGGTAWSGATGITTMDTSASGLAYGLYADDGAIENNADASVSATGGSATGTATDTQHEVFASASAYGLYLDDDDWYAYTDRHLSNSGNLTATATGGSAQGSVDEANASAWAYGLKAFDAPIVNSGQIAAAAAGGTALSTSTAGEPGAYASALAYGIDSHDGDVDNSGAITSGVTGGTATGQGVTEASAYAEVAAIHVSGYGTVAEGIQIENTGPLVATATGGVANSLSAAAHAYATAYGLAGSYADVNNTGTIMVTATGGTANTGSHGFDTPMGYRYSSAETSAEAYGIQTVGGVNNSGNIAVTATGGVAGPNHADPDSDASSAATAYAAGIYAEGTINNTGNIMATAISGTAESNDHPWADAYAYAHADGIRAHRGDVNNTGSILITAHGETSDAFPSASAQGIYAYDGNISNLGSITIMTSGAEGDAVGILANVGNASNAGSISITVNGESSGSGDPTAYALATGIHAYGGNVSNIGNVSVTAAGGTADGSRALACGIWTNGGVDNAGAIMVAAAGGITDVSSAFASALAEAYGITADGQVNNTADITVTATGGIANPQVSADANAVAHGITAGAVNNSGDITVTGTAQEGFTSSAYGIYMDGEGHVTNTGTIRATADTAYELYVASGITTLVDTYNVTLDGDPNRASLGVADGATLALNNATLTATAIAGETLWDTEYRLFETEGTGVVDGNFAEVRAVNPNTTATYHDQGTAGSVDDTVSLAYTPGAAPTLASAAVAKQAISQAVDVVNHHMTTVLLQNILFPPSSGLLASAGSTAESLALVEGASGKSVGVFVEPYYSRVDKDADPLGYDAKLWGFSAGYERYLGDTLLSLHLGYGRSDIDYTGAGYRGNSEDQDVLTGGLSGLTRWDPWVLHYGLTGFYGSHDYQGLTGLALDERETASYDSYGVAATLMAGHIFRWDSHVLLPEAGLNWLWVHRQRYTTEATDPSWDATYSALDDHDLYAAAALRWLSSFLHDDVRVTPSAAVGIRHLLTDTEASVWQSIPGAAPVLVKSKQDRTALTLSGSLILTKTRHAVSLSYDGDYFPDAQRHSVWLRYSWLF